MGVTIPNTAEASKAALARLAQTFGPLPDAYLRFVGQHDGAEPSDNVFAVGTDNQSGVRCFVSVAEAVDTRNRIEGFPAGAIPFAEDGCGNYVYLKVATGELYFWDHEVEGGDILLAQDVDAFLVALRPFDAATVQLKPGQAKVIWLNPDFKPEF